MKRTLRDLAEKLGCHFFGDPNVCVSTVSSLQSATKESLVFVEDAEHLGAALASAAGAVIAKEFPSGQSLSGQSSSDQCSKPILISAQPRLTFARAAKLLCEPARDRIIHSTAIIHSSATVGKNVAIGVQAVVGERVSIGDETTIGAGAVIGDDAAIGAHCRIDANVTIYEGTRIGDRVVVQAGAVLGSEGFGYVRDAATGRYEQFPQIGRLVIEDDVEISANNTI